VEILLQTFVHILHSSSKKFRNKINKYEKGRFCAALERWRYSCKILFLEPEGKKRLRQYGVTGRIILEWILTE